MAQGTSIYEPLPQQGDLDGSSEKLLEESSDDEIVQRGAGTSIWCQYSVWMVLGCILVANAIVLYNHAFSRPACKCEDQSLSGLYSPANLAVEYSLVRFNGTFGLESPYTGTPSPEVEAAWDRITTNNLLRAVRLPDDYYESMDMPGQRSNVRFHEEDGGGYMGTLDLFHVLHCLNMLRQYTYLDYYPRLQEIQRTRPVFFREHLDHCLDTLRQNIMCAGDIAVMTYDWVEDHNKPFPNFNTVHKCRNFDKILDWTNENTLQIPRSHVTRIGDEIDLPESAVDLKGVLNIRKNATPI